MVKEQHPTLFVLEGSIHHYEDGSMLELYSKISQDEWFVIVEETVSYKIFLDCLKEVACPTLKETWDEEDEWYRIQLDIAISRMRNLDPLVVSKHDQKAIKSAFVEKMTKNAKEVVELINEMKENRRKEIGDKYNTNVSNL